MLVFQSQQLFELGRQQSKVRGHIACQNICCSRGCMSLDHQYCVVQQPKACGRRAMQHRMQRNSIETCWGGLIRTFGQTVRCHTLHKQVPRASHPCSGWGTVGPVPEPTPKAPAWLCSTFVEGCQDFALLWGLAAILLASMPLWRLCPGPWPSTAIATMLCILRVARELRNAFPRCCPLGPPKPRTVSSETFQLASLWREKSWRLTGVYLRQCSFRTAWVWDFSLPLVT